MGSESHLADAVNDTGDHDVQADAHISNVATTTGSCESAVDSAQNEGGEDGTDLSSHCCPCPFLSGDDFIHISCACRAHANLVYQLLDMPLLFPSITGVHVAPHHDDKLDISADTGDEVRVPRTPLRVCKYACTCPDTACLLE